MGRELWILSRHTIHLGSSYRAWEHLPGWKYSHGCLLPPSPPASTFCLLGLFHCSLTEDSGSALADFPNPIEQNHSNKFAGPGTPEARDGSVQKL